MNANTLKTKFQLRRDTYSNWHASNPQLADGEPILVNIEENGVYKLKIGDGNTHFDDLPYYGGGGSGDADWVTLLNKPFYEKQVAEQIITVDYTKDPDATGTINTVEVKAFKISDNVYLADEMKQFEFSGEIAPNRGNLMSIPFFSPTDENLEIDPSSVIINYIVEGNPYSFFASVFQDNITINGVKIVEKGLYALLLEVPSAISWKGTAVKIPAHTELKKIDKKFLHLDWADIENKPFGETTIPATHYDLSDTSKYTDIVDATEYGEYGDFYKPSNQQAYFNQLMQDEFYFDYKLNDTTYTISKEDCIITPYKTDGTTASSVAEGSYLEMTYTDSDGDMILKCLAVYSLPEDINTITYQDITDSVNIGDIFITKYVKKEKTADIEHPNVKIVTPIRTYTNPHYVFDDSVTPIVISEEGQSTNFYKVSDTPISSNTMTSLTGYAAIREHSYYDYQYTNGAIEAFALNDIGSNVVSDGVEFYALHDMGIIIAQATKDNATLEFDTTEKDENDVE